MMKVHGDREVYERGRGCMKIGRFTRGMREHVDREVCKGDEGAFGQRGFQEG